MSDPNQWALVILANSSDAEGRRVIDAMNELQYRGKVSRASNIMACAQILAHHIAEAEPDITSEVRDGIVKLIDICTAAVAASKATQ